MCNQQEQIVVVSGVGRCGSSLTMQMLHAGGYPTIGEYPAFEDIRAGAFGHDTEWISKQQGKAIKILTPLAINKFLGADYKFIWVDRNPLQQAISQVKFGNLMMGLPANRKIIKTYENSYRSEKQEHINHIKKYTKHDIFYLTFENLLKNPTECARTIIEFVGASLDIEAMANQVIKRPPEAEKGLDIEIKLSGLCR